MLFLVSDRKIDMQQLAMKWVMYKQELCRWVAHLPYNSAAKLLDVSFSPTQFGAACKH